MLVILSEASRPQKCSSGRPATDQTWITWTAAEEPQEPGPVQRWSRPQRQINDRASSHSALFSHKPPVSISGFNLFFWVKRYNRQSDYSTWRVSGNCHWAAWQQTCLLHDSNTSEHFRNYSCGHIRPTTWWLSFKKTRLVFARFCSAADCQWWRNVECDDRCKRAAQTDGPSVCFRMLCSGVFQSWSWRGSSSDRKCFHIPAVHPACFVSRHRRTEPSMLLIRFSESGGVSSLRQDTPSQTPSPQLEESAMTQVLNLRCSGAFTSSFEQRNWQHPRHVNLRVYCAEFSPQASAQLPHSLQWEPPDTVAGPPQMMPDCSRAAQTVQFPKLCGCSADFSVRVFHVRNMDTKQRLFCVLALRALNSCFSTDRTCFQWVVVSASHLPSGWMTAAYFSSNHSWTFHLFVIVVIILLKCHIMLNKLEVEIVPDLGCSLSLRGDGGSWPNQNHWFKHVHSWFQYLRKWHRD